MRIALIQQHATEDRDENRRRGLDAFERAARDGAQVIAYAELAFDPFYPQAPATPDALAQAEPVPGPTTDAFAAKARELGVACVLNVFERDGEKTYDASPVIDADGTLLGVTRMLHIAEFECFHEQGYYAEGDRGAPVYDTRFGRIGVAICYDRHYPEVMRALGEAGAQVVFVPQAGAVGEWPDGLFEAEMRVAAFQNGYFTALCNRVGEEPRVTFAGESFVCDPEGVVVARAGQGTDEILACDLDLARVESSTARRLFWRDRRDSIAPPVDCAAEVCDLHRFFEAWFRGDDADFARFERALADGFAIVGPDGERRERAPILERVHGARGCRPDMKIEIRNCDARPLGAGRHLVTYEEWLDGRGRRSTALLRETGSGLQWLHVHETWMTP